MHQATRIHTVFSRSAHSYQKVRRGIPALSPDRGRPIAVPHRQRPSLHHLRRGQNPLCSVASSVLLRCPTSHPRACSSFGFCLHEPARACPGMNEISQVPVKGLLHVHGVYDGARFVQCLPVMHRHDVAFSSAERDQHLEIRPLSPVNTQPMVSPVNASRLPSRVTAHHSGSERLAGPYSVEDFHLLSFASFAWRTPLLADCRLSRRHFFSRLSGRSSVNAAVRMRLL